MSAAAVEARLLRVRRIAESAQDKKAEALVALDVRALTSYTDTLLLLTATSDRHARAIADAIVDAARDAGSRPLGVEGYDEGRWVLIDLGDVIVHIFQAEVRAKYDLERLWSDAPPIELAAPPVAAGLHGATDALS